MISILEGRKIFMISYMKDLIIIIQTNPNKFLDTKIIENKGAIETNMYRMTTKLPVPWASNIPKGYKRNTINTDLYRGKRIATNSAIRLQEYSNCNISKRVKIVFIFHT